MPSCTVVTACHPAVGTPAASMTSFACALDPSSRAAAADGPKAGIPRSPSASASPATSGASGPITTSPAPSASATRTRPPTSSTATSSTRASAAMPGFPGAASSSCPPGDRASARTIACSRPPAPTTRIFTAAVRSERGDEVVDRDRRQRLVAARAARPELEAHARHRRLVRRLDDGDEVVLAEDRPLRLDDGAQLLDLGVDLANALRVVLDRLDALGGEGGEHDVRRHLASCRTGECPPPSTSSAGSGCCGAYPDAASRCVPSPCPPRWPSPRWPPRPPPPRAPRSTAPATCRAPRRASPSPAAASRRVGHSTSRSPASPSRAPRVPSTPPASYAPPS